MEKILIVGGGTAGTLAANMLVRSLDKEVKQEKVEVRVLDDNGKHLFQPNLLYVAFRGKHPESLAKDENRLLLRQVKLTIDPAKKIDLDNRLVTTERGTKLSYDRLIISPGSTVTQNGDGIPGFSEANLNFHSTPKMALEIWKKINTIRKGKIVVGICGSPYKCPPAPVESAFLLEEFLRKRGLKDSVEIHFVTPLPRPYPLEAIGSKVQKMFDERGIVTHTFFNIDSVDNGKKTISSMEGDELSFDAMFMVPLHKGPQVVIDSGIGDEDGWIPADRNTMKMKGGDDVFAVGDVADLPTSKSGVNAHLEAIVVARNMTSEIRGTGEVCHYTGRTNCPLDTGYKEAFFVVTTYNKPARPVRPSPVNWILKKGFAMMYWMALKGTLEPVFNFYFGEDARTCIKA